MTTPEVKMADESRLTVDPQRDVEAGLSQMFDGLTQLVVGLANAHLQSGQRYTRGQMTAQTAEVGYRMLPLGVAIGLEMAMYQVGYRGGYTQGGTEAFRIAADDYAVAVHQLLQKAGLVSVAGLVPFSSISGRIVEAMGGVQNDE